MVSKPSSVSGSFMPKPSQQHPILLVTSSFLDLFFLGTLAFQVFLFFFFFTRHHFFHPRLSYLSILRVLDIGSLPFHTLSIGIFPLLCRIHRTNDSSLLSPLVIFFFSICVAEVSTPLVIFDI